jgi:hypothetical protein
MAPKRTRKQKRIRGGEIQFEYGGENMEANRAVPIISNYVPLKAHTNYHSSNIQTIHHVLPTKQHAPVSQVQRAALTQAFVNPAKPTKVNTYRSANKKQAHKLNHYLARNSGTRKLFRK